MLPAGMPGSASVAGVGIQAVGSQFKNEKAELCLDSDGQGNVYTKGCAWDKHNAYQQWGAKQSLRSGSMFSTCITYRPTGASKPAAATP